MRTFSKSNIEPIPNFELPTYIELIDEHVLQQKCVFALVARHLLIHAWQLLDSFVHSVTVLEKKRKFDFFKHETKRRTVLED